MSRGSAGAEIVRDDRDREQAALLGGENWGGAGLAPACLCPDDEPRAPVRRDTGPKPVARDEAPERGVHSVLQCAPATEGLPAPQRGKLPGIQGRFKAQVVQDQGYWSELSGYVHLNPVRAGMADVLGAEPSSWSLGRRIDSGHRATAAYAARRLVGYRRDEVAHALGYRSPSSVAHAERRVGASGHLRRLARKAAAQVASS